MRDSSNAAMSEALAPCAGAVVADRHPTQQVGALAERLVLDAEQLAAAGGEVAAADEAHRCPTGGAVERLGDRGPPVDDQ